MQLFDNIPFYEYNEITDDMLYNAVENIDIVSKRNIKYINCANALDIESSSFKINEEKRATMYIWQFSLNELCFYGRTWDELIDFFTRLQKLFMLEKNYRIVVYVQFLGYEFQWFRKLFSWHTVFARKIRKPLQAITNIGIEFRCSYFLSGNSLRDIAKNLLTYKINKLDGDLDYKKIRHSKTPLTYKELHYCINDILIVTYFVKEEIERCGDIGKIPLTKTGYVRRMIKESCYDKNIKKQYNVFSEFIHELTLDVEEYKQLKRTYSGGFTHANARVTGKTINDVTNIDFKSSYPAVIFNEKYPISKGELIKSDDATTNFEYYTNNYCCIFDIEFFNLEPITAIEHPISFSKCLKIENYVVDNGRVVSAEYLFTSLTEVDFKYMKLFYTWSEFKIYNFRIYLKNYLPKQIISPMLYAYRLKTELKGIESEKMNYQRSKENVNSFYGMMVTDISPDIIDYKNNEWKKSYDDKQMEQDIKDYNDEKQRILFYPWGIYVTAYARANLFYGIASIGTDYCYSDTDSIKLRNYEHHVDYINAYNQIVREKNTRAAEYHKIDIEATRPKNKFGEEQELGVWEVEKPYTRFKTLGAKRYFIQRENEFEITISGVRKKDGVNYMLEYAKKKKKDVFDIFKEGLVIPEGHTGKSTLLYIDEETEGLITDYRGETAHFKECSSIYSEETSYEFSLSGEYLNYLKGIEDEIY